MWQQVVGEVDIPVYRFGEFEGSVQTTLDCYRSNALFRDAVDAAHKRLEERYGGGNGINTAVQYGSNVAGLSLFPDAIRNAGTADGSDMDLLVVLEDGPQYDERRQAALRTLRDDVTDRSPSPREEHAVQVNPMIYERTEFLDEMTCDASEDPREAAVRMRMPYHEFELDFIPRYRAFLTGFIMHPEHTDPAMRKVIHGGVNELLHDGDIDPAVREDVERGAKEYSGRIDALRENYQLGRMFRRHVLGDRRFRDYREAENGFVVDTNRPERLDIQGLYHEIAFVEAQSDQPPVGREQAPLSAFASPSGSSRKRDIVVDSI